MAEVTDELWDIVIVGGGPAGSTAAIAATRTWPEARVLILDAATFPRDKPCGDCVTQQALDCLDDLGVDAASLVAGYAPITRRRLVSPNGLQAAGDLAGHQRYHIVPRSIFDHRLLTAAQTVGVTVRRHTVRSVTASPSGVMLDSRIRAHTVVGADGAESVVRRQLGARAGTLGLAIRGYVPADPWPADELLSVLSWDRKKAPGYAWVFPLGDGRANVGYGELLGERPVSRAYLEHRLRTLLPDAAPSALRGHRLPMSTGRPEPGHDRVLLAGDAAALINPLSGEGISYAVLSGALAGTAALDTDPGTAYRQALHDHLEDHLREIAAFAQLCSPTALEAVVAAARNHQAFDSLYRVVEFGRTMAR